MRFKTETDLRTGKRFFNPQQDMADEGMKRYVNSIRRCQDLMAFLYFSSFVSRNEKKDISQTIGGLEEMREILAGHIGYHPDNEPVRPKQDNFQVFVKANKISQKHLVLKLLYYLKQLMGKVCPGRESVSDFVTLQMNGGFYFQRWQAKQDREE